MNNSEIQSLLKMIKKDQRIQKENQVRSRMNKLVNGINYKIILNYNKFYNKEKKSMIEEISMEGYKNAMSLFEEYRKIGFNLVLNSVKIELDNKVVMNQKFTYTNGRENW